MANMHVVIPFTFDKAKRLAEPERCTDGTAVQQYYGYFQKRGVLCLWCTPTQIEEAVDTYLTDAGYVIDDPNYMSNAQPIIESCPDLWYNVTVWGTKYTAN